VQETLTELPDEEASKRVASAAPRYPYQRIAAILVGLLVIASLQLVWMNRGARASGGRDISSLLVYTVAGIPLAFGLWARKRWVAVLFALALGALGGTMAYGSVGTVPYPEITINLTVSAMMCGLAAAVFWEGFGGRRSG